MSLLLSSRAFFFTVVFAGQKPSLLFGLGSSPVMVSVVPSQSIISFYCSNSVCNNLPISHPYFVCCRLLAFLIQLSDFCVKLCFSCPSLRAYNLYDDSCISLYFNIYFVRYSDVSLSFYGYDNVGCYG